MFRITKAEALGTCFGVRDAIEEAMDPQFSGNLTIIGELVHNARVVKQLQENGIKMVKSVDDPIDTPNVMITAHGAARSVHRKASERGFRVFDATCPLVMKVHKNIRKLISEGYFPVVVGKRDHVEVKGIVTDLDDYEIITDETDLSKIENKPRVGVVSQTTNQLKEVKALVEKIKRMPNPDGSEKDVKFLDTVCKPTKDRQSAVEKLSDEVDLMIVVGGKNSSNTKKLKKVCDEKSLRAYHIQSANDLKDEWFEAVSHVGITAGTSTPHFIIQEVHDRIEEIGKRQDREKTA